MIKRLLVIGISVSMSLCYGIGQEVMVEKYINQKYPINYDVKILATSSFVSENQAKEMLNAMGKQGDFNPISPGYTNKHYWLAFDLISQSTNSLLMEIADAHIDSISVYHYENGKVVKQFETGDHYPFNSRPAEFRTFVFPLTLSSSTNEYLISIYKTSSSLSMPIYLWDHESFDLHYSKSTGLHWAFFGLILAFTISAFFIYFINRDVTYLLFSLHTLFSGLFIFGTYGYAAQFLLADFPQANDFFRPTITWANSIIGIFFFISYLKINTYHHKIAWILKAIAVGLIILLLIGYYDVSWTYRHGILILNTLFFFFTLAICLILWTAIKTFSAERFRVFTFFISAFFAMLGALVFLFMSYGHLDPISPSFDPVSIGLCAEITGFGLALLAMVQIKKTSEPFSTKYESSKLSALLETIRPEEIEYISSQDHHCQVHASNERADKSIRISIKEFSDLLPKDRFIRIHRSYIVNTNFIKIKYSDKVILYSGASLPISRSYKKSSEDFLSASS